MGAIAATMLDIPAGGSVRLVGVSWQDFEAIQNELGEVRSSCLAYDSGILKIMSPLPRHERLKEIIGDLLKVLIEETGQQVASYGSFTQKRPDLFKGIEADASYYITNESVVRGRDRIDLTVDPPPDLVLEIDITNASNASIYAALGVTELWRHDGERLYIYTLEDGEYLESDSQSFPGWELTRSLPEYIEIAKQDGETSAVRRFRQYVRKRVAD